MFPSVDKKSVCDDVEKLAGFHFDMDIYVDGYIEAYKHSKDIGLFLST